MDGRGHVAEGFEVADFDPVRHRLMLRCAARVVGPGVMIAAHGSNLVDVLADVIECTYKGCGNKGDRDLMLRDYRRRMSAQARKNR